jgi:hypothetical protein
MQPQLPVQEGSSTAGGRDGEDFASTAALLRVWDREGEATEWDDFIAKLHVPESTWAIFGERYRRIVQKSRSLGWVFLF